MVSFAFKGLRVPKKTKKWQNTLCVSVQFITLTKMRTEGWSNLILNNTALSEK